MLKKEELIKEALSNERLRPQDLAFLNRAQTASSLTKAEQTWLINLADRARVFNKNKGMKRSPRSKPHQSYWYRIAQYHGR